VLAVNEAWERYVGFRRDAAVGRPVSEFAAWARPEERAEVVAQLAREGRLSNLQTRFKRADGTEIDVLVSAAPIELEGEQCAIWAWRDVTEQLRLERERQEADARYRALFETALDGILVGTQQNILVDANPAACAMTGYGREELVGMPVARIFHPDDLVKRPLRPDLGQRWSVVERRLARKGGGEVQVEIVAGPMPDGHVLAMVRDITERKRSEALLMNIARGVSAELGGRFFRSLAEHLARELGADFAFIGELTGGGTQIRPMAFLMDGALVAQAEHPLAGSMSEQALAAGRTVIFDKGVRERFPGNADMQKEGVEAYVGTPLHGADGVPLGVLAVGHRRPIARPQFWASMIEIFGARAAAEIERSRAEELVFRTNTFLEQTVQERTSQLEEANRELESYSYSISHDLRQPLNAIGGFAELLREEVAGELSPTARDFVAEIENNSARMQQMIESLLELSRAGRGALHKSAVDARQVVHSVLHDLAANGALKAEVQVGELPAAAGDAVLLRQVWVNLIGNALKYSGRSPAPRVEIGGRRMDGMVEYSVRDNGVGFDMQHADRLFGAFQRLPTSAGFTGSGIGLAIVERIVQRHGGSIRAESMPGKGATFRFTLPDSPLT
jgi:PAS domain S-box-containing protein